MAIEQIVGFDIKSNESVDAVRAVAANETAMLAIKWVYDGLVCIRTDSSPHKQFICLVASATQSGPDYTILANWEEFTGTAGTNGIDGSQIFVGTGVPSDGVGANTDLYFDTSSGDYYQKAGGTWGSAQANLVGPGGSTGAQGADGDKYSTTSTTAIDIDAALTTLAVTTPSGLSYTAGQTVVIASRANPLVDYLTAIVTSYGSTTLAVGSITYYGTGSHTDWDVNLTGAPGQAGADGNDGAIGKGFIHEENDITLTDAKITTVQGGAWTPQDPWSASVQNDTRANKNLVAGIIGDMTSNSISYDGTAWYNNGRWLGLTGSSGDTGDTGEKGDDGSQGNQGIQGDDGVQGDTGGQGIPGSKGDTGDTGSNGADGADGDKGDNGNQGSQGDPGIQGEDGSGAYGQHITYDNAVTVVKNFPLSTDPDAKYVELSILAQRIAETIYTQVITNGGFSSGLTDWAQTAGSGTWAVLGGKASVTTGGIGQDSGILYQDTLTANTSYEVEFDYTELGSTIGYLVTLDSGNNIINQYSISGGDGTKNMSISSGAGGIKLGFWTDTGVDAATMTVDNVTAISSAVNVDALARGFKIAAIASRNEGSSLLVGSVQTIQPSWGDAALSGLTVTMDVSSNNLRFKVTGLTNSTIRWTWNEVNFLSTDT